jgi:hypothetical protein
MLSFYVDVVVSGISMLALWANPRSEAGDFLQRSIPGTLMHGLGHAFLSVNGGGGGGESGAIAFADLSFPLQIIAPLGGFLFFRSLLGTNAHIPPLHLNLSSFLAMIGLLVLPPHFGFAYVQTVLVLVFSFYDIVFRPPSAKNRVYFLAALVSLPFSLVAWAEGLGCEEFLRDLGGHAWYDGSIAVSLLLFYYVARDIDGGEAARQETKKKQLPLAVRKLM